MRFAVPLLAALQYLVPPANPGGWSRTWRSVWQRPATRSTSFTAFERTSKRRKGYPSETRVKRGYRLVHGDKELIEKRCCLRSGNHDGVYRDYYF